jgi:hypothetical protein
LREPGASLGAGEKNLAGVIGFAGQMDKEIREGIEPVLRSDNGHVPWDVKGVGGKSAGELYRCVLGDAVSGHVGEIPHPLGIGSPQRAIAEVGENGKELFERGERDKGTRNRGCFLVCREVEGREGKAGSSGGQEPGIGVFHGKERAAGGPGDGLVEGGMCHGPMIESLGESDGRKTGHEGKRGDVLQEGRNEVLLESGQGGKVQEKVAKGVPVGMVLKVKDGLGEKGIGDLGLERQGDDSGGLIYQEGEGLASLALYLLVSVREHLYKWRAGTKPVKGFLVAIENPEAGGKRKAGQVVGTVDRCFQEA